MAGLRSAAFARSRGLCECGRAICEERPLRLRTVNWVDGQLRHIISRAHGGSDVLQNVQFITRQCHREITGDLQWSRTEL